MMYHKISLEIQVKILCWYIRVSLQHGQSWRDISHNVVTVKTERDSHLELPKHYIAVLVQTNVVYDNAMYNAYHLQLFIMCLNK